MRHVLQTVAAALLLTIPSSAAHLGTPAKAAFQEYNATLEKRLSRQHAASDTYLATLNVGAPQRSEIERQLRSGEVRVEAVDGGTREITGGLLHHWRGAAFVPGATAADILALLQDYDRLSQYYAPEVESSRLIKTSGGIATVAMRMRKQKVMTVVLDSDYQVQSGLTGTSSGYSISRSTHIWQIESPGTPRERRQPEGDDDGFLWRLNSYWSFREAPGGLFIECEAVSLTRDVPTGLSWLVLPVIQDMPRESLQFTLTATRNALQSAALKRRNG
jgi:hypothetical protein